MNRFYTTILHRALVQRPIQALVLRAVSKLPTRPELCSPPRTAPSPSSQPGPPSSLALWGIRVAPPGPVSPAAALNTRLFWQPQQQHSTLGAEGRARNGRKMSRSQGRRQPLNRRDGLPFPLIPLPTSFAPSRTPRKLLAAILCFLLSSLGWDNASNLIESRLTACRGIPFRPPPPSSLLSSPTCQARPETNPNSPSSTLDSVECSSAVPPLPPHACRHTVNSYHHNSTHFSSSVEKLHGLDQTLLSAVQCFRRSFYDNRST